MRWIVGLTWAVLWLDMAYGMEFKKEQLSGAWEYDESYNRLPKGERKTLFGNAPKGQFVLLPNGIYNHIIIHQQCRDVVHRKDCESNGRTLSHYGTYTVDEKAGTFTASVKYSNDKKLIGKKQLRTITRLDNDHLHYTNHLSIAGPDARVIATLRRVSP